MVKAEANGWPGLGYVPVEAARLKIQARLHRAGRRNMLRFFAERGLSELYERLKWLRDQSNLSGMEKVARYRRIESDYIKHITAKPSIGEAEGVEGARQSGVVLPAEGGVEALRAGGDAEGSVPGLEAEIIGDT